MRIMQVGIGVQGKTKEICCGGCGHTLSNHKITTTRKSSKISGRCKICGCNGISIE